MKDWRFNDSANHILNEPPANGGRGSLVLPAYGYAILASDATTTIINYPSYSGIVIDTAMSLGNTSETLKIIDVNEAIIDAASYNSSMGANGDGKTLQKFPVRGLQVFQLQERQTPKVARLPPVRLCLLHHRKILQARLRLQIPAAVQSHGKMSRKFTPTPEKTRWESPAPMFYLKARR